jgi:hypothetical protein
VVVGIAVEGAAAGAASWVVLGEEDCSPVAVRAKDDAG